MSDLDPIEYLSSVQLFQDIDEADLSDLAHVLRRRTIREGEVLWREGDEATDMALIVNGRVAITRRRPGEHVGTVIDFGPGETLGEIPLFDGGRHTATASVTEAATVLLLGRADFAGLVSRRHPSAFALKRRVGTLATARLRSQLEYLAASLVDGPDTGVAVNGTQTSVELEFCGPPDSRYVRRMATFRAFDPLALWGFLTAGRYARCGRGQTLVAEGAQSTACYLTINGAVEKVLIRGGRRIRVGLAGPGQAFGYESLIDGRRAPVTAVTRERVLLLLLPKEPFHRLFGGETAESHVFLDVINRDVTASWRQALRPQAQLVQAPAPSASPNARGRSPAQQRSQSATGGPRTRDLLPESHEIPVASA
jgi:CRP-like cAMP-binding protein